MLVYSEHYYRYSHPALQMSGMLEMFIKVLTRELRTGTGWNMGPCVGNTGSVPGKFPSLCLQDGPLGVRYADLITAFPYATPSFGCF